MKNKTWDLPQNQYGNETLLINENVATENHEYIFETLTKVTPPIATEYINEFIDDYSFIQESLMKEFGFSRASILLNKANTLKLLKSMAETMKDISMTKHNDGFTFDNYRPFLVVISDNGFCDNISNELNRILLDYAILKLKELSVEPDSSRAAYAFELIAFMEALYNGIEKIRFIPILQA